MYDSIRFKLKLKIAGSVFSSFNIGLQSPCKHIHIFEACAITVYHKCFKIILYDQVAFKLSNQINKNVYESSLSL